MSKPVDVSNIIGATLWLAEGHYQRYNVRISETDARTLRTLAEAGSVVTMGTSRELSIVHLSMSKESDALVNVEVGFMGVP